MTKKMKPGSRAFTVVSSTFGYTGGRYVAMNPAEAGRKAGRKLFMKAENERRSSTANNFVQLELMEITRSPDVHGIKDRYFYTVERKPIPAAQQKQKTFKSGSPFTAKYTYVPVSTQETKFAGDHRGGFGFGDTAAPPL